MTSRSPWGTVMALGEYDMSCASTRTRVVWPVGSTAARAPPTEAPLPGEATTSPAAAGSAATPRVTTRARLATAVSSWAPDVARGAGTGAGAGLTPASSASATETSSARRAATAARIARSSRGRNATRAPSTSTDTATRTVLGEGSRQTSRPRLTTVTRHSDPRSSHAWAARTTDGPPPSTDGMR